VTILSAECDHLNEVNAQLLAALKSFVDYYDQAGIGPCDEGQDDEDCGDCFDGDERFNVRQGRAAIRRATNQE
jgi:hypothetical protein